MQAIKIRDARERNEEPIPATFVASVRVDVKDIASIAVFYNSIGRHLGTTSKLVSEVIKNSAGLLQENFAVQTTTEAIEILNNLRYEDVMRRNARHHQSLVAALSLESKQEITQDSNMNIIGNIMNNETKVSLPTTKAKETIMAEAPEETLRKTYDLDKVSKAPMTEEEITEATANETIDVKNMRKGMDLGTAEESKNV